jgi:small subunit ribosomal protein S21
MVWNSRAVLSLSTLPGRERRDAADLLGITGTTVADAGKCMLRVYVRSNDVDAALRVLKRKVQKAGLFHELRQRREYEKPSERRRREKRQGIKNTRKREQVISA